MKEVILKKLTAVNFKGFENETFDFNPKEQSFRGRNGVGKTSIFDAFTWLLFGKDHLDNQKFGIKRLVNGDSIKKVDTEVECVISIDGEDVVLKRVLSEDWVTPRGQAEEVLKGHTTKTYINDVPMKRMKDYQEKVDSIISEDLFKMITNPEFFVSMDWKAQREQLFTLAGVVSDEEVAENNEAYKDLLKRITGKTLAEYKSEVTTKKNKMSKELKDIQPRIDQTSKLMPKDRDWSKLEAKEKELSTKIKSLEKSKEDKSESMKVVFEEKQGLQSKINELKGTIQSKVFEANQKEVENKNKSLEVKKGIDAEIESKQSEVKSYEGRIRTLDVEAKGLSFQRTQKTEKIENLRKEWVDTNAKEYTPKEGKIVCPLYGIVCNDPQALEKKDSDASKATLSFNETKRVKLKEINEVGKSLGQELKQLESEIKEKLDQKQVAESNLSNLNLIIEGLYSKAAKLPKYEPKTYKASDIEECVAIQSQIDTLELKISNLSANIDTSEIDAKKEALELELDNIKLELNDKKLILSYQNEIDNLESQAAKIAQEIANCEKDEDLVKGFTKDKILECENRINGLFKLVSFKLFDYTIEGNEFEVCVPMMGGVPYSDLNTAKKLNAGLDIINTLTKFYNTTAPIFIDGRESVTDIIDTASQVINLIVDSNYDKVTSVS